jgi:hypothetical protein
LKKVVIYTVVSKVSEHGQKLEDGKTKKPLDTNQF